MRAVSQNASDTDQDIVAKTRTNGQTIFVLLCLAISLFLLSQLWTETKWAEPKFKFQKPKNFAQQPRVWVAAGLGLMIFGFGVHYWRMKRRRPNRIDVREARQWLAPIEHMGWFMVYVFAVPVIGFLFASVLFAPALTWRVGYRRRRFLIAAAAVAATSVIVFKTLLGVGIPGGALYELFPKPLNSFFIANF